MQAADPRCDGNKVGKLMQHFHNMWGVTGSRGGTALTSTTLSLGVLNAALYGEAQAQAFEGSAFAEPRCDSSKVCWWMQHFHMQGSEGAGGQGEQSQGGPGKEVQHTLSTKVPLEAIKWS